MLTERDLVRLTAFRIDLSKITVAQVMRQQVMTVTQSNSQDVLAVLSLLRQHRMRHLPILDESGKLVGIVTPESVRQALPFVDLYQGQCVAEVMTEQVIHAPASTSLLSLARLMSDHNVSCVVIAEADSENCLFPLGIITERDIMQFQDLEMNLAQTQAAVVMSCPLFCLGAANSLWFAHQEMQRHQIRRLVVTGAQGELVGIITGTSLLQVFEQIETCNISSVLGQKIQEKTIQLGQTSQQLQHEIVKEVSINKVAEYLLDNASNLYTPGNEKKTCKLNDKTNSQHQQKETALHQGHQELVTKRSEPPTAKLSPFDAFLQQELRLSEGSRKARQQAEDYIKFQAKVLSQVNDAIIAIDNQRRITYCNRKAEQLLNLKVNEVLGRTLEEAYHYRWLKVEDEQAAFNSIAATGSWQGENILIKASGEEIYVESSLSVLKDDRALAIGLLSVIREISGRKQAEQKISEQAALLDITTDAILVRALDNQILFWNKGAEHLYGWKAQEVATKNANELLYTETLQQIEEAFRTVLETSSWQGELHQVTKQGKEIIVFSRWALVRDEQQQPKSILTVNTDITQKKQLEAQLLRTQRLETIGSLAGGIAHDLNNLLAPILMTAQLLETQLHDERSKRLLTIVVTNAKRGASLVKQVLSFSRGLESERTLLQVRHLIAEVQQIAQETFPKNIELSTDISPSLWTVFADAIQVHQVLMNLVINARDAMSCGGRLSISAENQFIDRSYARMNRDAAVGPYIIITVADTGTGIPPEILPQIFEPFFTTKEPGLGTGLGLSTAMRIIKSLGGFVNVSSQVRQGTQFQVYLPAAEGTQTQPDEDLELALGNGELILVVDDETAISEIIKASLETYVYQVLTASDGIEAIALYVQHKDRISAVIMDMMMPQMDGLTTIRTLQKINPQIKIIATSGLGFNEQVRFAMGTSVKALLSKPYTAPNLLKTLRSVLNAK